MGCVEPPRVKDRCTSADMGQLGFHDCRVSGIRWDASRFEVAFDLDYIVEWVAPMDGDGSYRFWISPAELRFANVDDVRIEAIRDRIHRFLESRTGWGIGHGETRS